MQVDGYSLDAQRDKLRKYAAYEDMVIAGEYSDEGFSGKNIQGRQDFQRMLNDIQDCKDGVSYVLDKSRLSIRLQPPMSEERRQKASENAKQNGFKSRTE